MADNNVQQNIILGITANAQGLNAAVAESKAELQSLGKVDVGTENVKSFKAQLREATQEAVRLQQAGQENTQEFRNAAAQIANLRDQQDVLNRTVSAFDPGNKFNAFIGIAKSAATAVQGYTGALSFLGVEGENAAETLAKLQGIMAFTDALNGIGDLQDYWKGFTATVKSSIGTLNAATLAAKGFGLALKSMGIGLIVAAVAYLVTNFEDLKEEFKDLIPIGDGLGKKFDQLKQIFFGVGNAVLQFIIAPIKAVIDLINGDLDKALNDLKKGADVVNNFNAGVAKEKANQAKDAEQELAKIQLEGAEYRMRLLKKDSKEYIAEENRVADLRIKAAENESDKKKAIQDKDVMYAQRSIKLQDEANKKAEENRKAASEKAKAESEKNLAVRKAALEEILKDEKEAAALLAQQNDTARDKELDDLRQAYDKKRALAEKYGKGIVTLTEAFAMQQAAVNAKYDKVIEDALNDRANKNLDAYTEKQNELMKFYDNLLLNASDKEKEIIEARRKAEQEVLGKESVLNNQNIRANIDLVTTASVNQVQNTDTPEAAKKKKDLITAAELEAENAGYNLKLAALQGNNLAVEQLQSEHNAKLMDLERQRVEAVKTLADAEKKARVDAIGVAGDALSSFGELAGEETVAGKVLAVAAATVATYLSATQAYASASLIPGYGYIAGPIAAAAAIATGLKNVQAIVNVKVPGARGGGGTTMPPITNNATAPTISASQAQYEDLVQDVRVINSDQTPLKAYIVDKDLQDAADRSSFIDSLNTL